MAIYAIGDIQGCFDPLQRLLSHIDFDARRDRLLLVGDLVNRGPQSLEVLRWARGLGERVAAVLGNHDLHLLRIAAGARRLKRKDTIGDVLAAPDLDVLIDWLRHRPLMHEEPGSVMVHAGLHPKWTVEEARARAREAEAALRAGDWRERLAEAYSGSSVPWRPDLAGAQRLRAILSIFVRLRTCTAGGRLCDYYGPPASAPEGCVPWFDFPDRASRDACVLIGHWSTLGLLVRDDVIALDTGCVWGETLTAIRLEDRAIFQVAA